MQKLLKSEMVNSLQIVVISFGIILAAVILNLCFPVLTEFVVSDVPVIWNSITSWFKPLYLYVLINCIIVTLIASSKFQQNQQNAVDNLPLLLLSQSDHDISPDDEDDVGAVEIDPSVEVADVVVRNFPADSASVVGIDTDNIIEGGHMEMIGIDYKEDIGDDEKKILLDDHLEMEAYHVEEGAGQQMELTEIAAESGPVLSLQHWNLGERSVWDEKPPRSNSNRFSHRSKLPIKSNINGGRGSSLRVVSKPKRYETLESTWKAITEGRGMPLTRHKRKSETWEDEDRRKCNLGTEQQDNSETPYNLKEEEEEGKSSRTRRKMKLKRESSPGQDELNRKVEAFIKKFNEEMRLQRQRSLQQYKDMMMRINEGNTTT